MKMMIFVSILVSGFMFYQVAVAHPADGREPNDLPPAFGTEDYGYPDGEGFADVEFQDSPDPNTLSDSEKYIIAGAEGMIPWACSVFSFIDLYVKIYGQVPAIVDEAAIRSCLGNDVDTTYIETLRSPLTGQFPRTDQGNFSTGDIYCRKLTVQDIEEVREFDSALNEMVESGEFFNPFSMETESAEFTSGVYYIRIYGINDVIYESIQYEVRPN